MAEGLDAGGNQQPQINRETAPMYKENKNHARWLVPDKEHFDFIQSLPENTRGVVNGVFAKENKKAFKPQELEKFVDELEEAALKDVKHNPNMDLRAVSGIRDRFYATIATRYNLAAGKRGVANETRAEYREKVNEYNEKLNNKLPMSAELFRPQLDFSPDMGGGGGVRPIRVEDVPTDRAEGHVSFLLLNDEDRNKAASLPDDVKAIVYKIHNEAAVNPAGWDPQALNDRAEDIHQQVRDGLLGREAREFAVRLSERAKEIEVRRDRERGVQAPSPDMLRPPRNIQGPDFWQGANVPVHLTADAVEQGFRRALGGERLPVFEQYDKYLLEEEWATSSYQKVTAENTPAFYRQMTERERREYDARIELLNAAHAKRAIVNFEGYSKDVGALLNGFTRSETQLLMDMPGVWEAMVIYARLMNDAQPIPAATRNTITKDRRGRNVETRESFNIFEAKNRTDEEIYRNYVKNSIRDAVRKGYTDPQTRRRYSDLSSLPIDERRNMEEARVRSAEQIAFNLLYVGNAFESLDGKWIKGEQNGIKIRKKAPEGNNEFLNFPLRMQMLPMDQLILATQEGRNKPAGMGPFGRWAHEQALRRRGGKAAEYSEVVLLPLTKKNAKKFWKQERVGTSENGKPAYKIFVPEVFDIHSIKSVWEEITIEKVQGGRKVKKSLFDYMVSGEKIDWDRLENQTFWGYYAFKCGRTGEVNDYLQGKKPLGATKGGGGREEWIAEVNGILSTFSEGENYDLKRRILYASGGIKTKERAPKIKGDKVMLKIEYGSRSYLTYLPDNKLFYPWDRISVLSSWI